MAPLSHAGGVVYRRHEESIEVLLVRARPAPHNWVLPKGHIEPGEAPPACARREVREEAGVDAAPEDYLGRDRFTTPRGEVVNIAFFLMRYVANVPSAEDREHGWFTFADARQLVPFSGALRILATAEALVHGHPGS